MPFNALNDGFDRSDLVTTELHPLPDISDDIQQTLTRLMGFDRVNGLFRLLGVDPGGQLYVTQTGSKRLIGVPYGGVATSTASLVMTENKSRGMFFVQNYGTNPMYVWYGDTSLTGPAIVIGPGGFVLDSQWIGAVSVQGQGGNTSYLAGEF